MFDIPEEWTIQINTIRKKFPDAVIAGGCLRDLFTGQAEHIKDIDVFLPMSTEAEVTEYINLERPDQIIINKMTNYGNMANDDVTAVFSTNITAGDTPIEFIAVNVTPDNVLTRFDFGICQIQYDGTLVSYTDQFAQDLENKQFTIVRADNHDQFNRTRKRFERLTSAKYKDYTLNLGDFASFISEDLL